MLPRSCWGHKLETPKMLTHNLIMNRLQRQPGTRGVLKTLGQKVIQSQRHSSEASLRRSVGPAAALGAEDHRVFSRDVTAGMVR